MCCKQLEVRNREQNHIYSLKRECFSCCPTVYTITNVADAEVGSIIEGGSSCPSLF